MRAPHLPDSPIDAGVAPAVVGATGRKYVTARTFPSLQKRVKPLPPDANAAASPAKLFQLSEHVEFRCERCRRDGIFDDCVAFDEASGLLSCVRCYSRIIRPKVYRPTRLVPFPSLLSWLNHEPQTVMTTVSSNALERPAEAAVPSGARIATQMITATSVADLAATPMNMPDLALQPSRLELAAPQRVTDDIDEEVAKVHPCLRVFGECVHGPVCFFVNAPATLSLAYLMGLSQDASEGETAVSVFDLPPKEPRPDRSNTEAFNAWVAARRDSSNQAEWQLWNQPATDDIVDRHVPPPQVPASADAAPDMDAIRSVLGRLKGSAP